MGDLSTAKPDAGVESPGREAPQSAQSARSTHSAAGSKGPRDDQSQTQVGYIANRADSSDSEGGSMLPAELVMLAPGAAQAIEAATQALRPHWHCLGALVAQGETVAAAGFRRTIR